MICGKSPRLAMRAPQAATTISRRKPSACSSPIAFSKSDRLNSCYGVTVAASLRVTVSSRKALSVSGSGSGRTSGVLASAGRALSHRGEVRPPQMCEGIAGIGPGGLGTAIHPAGDHRQRADPGDIRK
jgi:hypothetical protein